MRTFHNLNLIEEITQDPFSTIGQRNFSLLKAYTAPFVWYTEVKIEDSIKDSVDAMPTIEEYVTTQIGENNLRTVLFDYYIGWIAEDSRDLFELCINKIGEYENTYPVDKDKYFFEINPNVENLDLKKKLKHMLLRPSMYGFEGLAGLRAYLDGYFRFKRHYDLKLSEYEIRLIKYIEYWKNKVNRSIPFETWDRPFRKEKMGTTDFTNNTNWEFEKLEEILKEDLQMELDDIKKGK
ncbi:MAG: hypothetical protein ACWA41_00390 [Putridiphycobacter sp.]